MELEGVAPSSENYPSSSTTCLALIHLQIAQVLMPLEVIHRYFFSRYPQYQDITTTDILYKSLKTSNQS